MSPSVEAVLGYPPDAFYADPGLMARLVHPDDRHLLDPGSGAPPVTEATLMRRCHTDGRWVWLEQRSTPVLDAEGRLVAIEGVVRDVSDRQVAQAHLTRLNRILRTLSAANEGLVRAETEPALLATICRTVVEQGGFRFAWVGYREEDPTGTVRPMAHAGYEAGYLASVTVSWHDTEHGRGPAGVAIRSGRPVISRDLAADPAMAPWAPEALARGYASVAALPLARDGEVFGVLVIYSDECNAFGDEEIVLLEELTADLAYSVGTLRARAARAAGDAERTRLATAIEQTAESVVITDPDANIVYVNPAFERITGYTAAEVIGRNPRFLQSGVQQPAVYADMWSTLTAGGTWTGELVNRRKDGTTHTEEASITPVVDAQGALASYVAVKRDVTHLREVEASLAGSARERAQIAATLSQLQAGETPEVTGQAIADALLGLDGMDSPTVLAFDESGRAVVLGRGAGCVGPAEVGETLPASRSAHLLERARAGGWTERWVPRPEDGEYGSGTPPPD